MPHAVGDVPITKAPPADPKQISSVRRHRFEYDRFPAPCKLASPPSETGEKENVFAAGLAERRIERSRLSFDEFAAE